MRYTSLPAPFAPSVEKLIVDKVHELAKKTELTDESPPQTAQCRPQ
ncbi:MAG: hypothetical protein ACODAD_02675 [Planctomycetota bacterium]